MIDQLTMIYHQLTIMIGRLLGRIGICCTIIKVTFWQGYYEPLTHINVSRRSIYLCTTVTCIHVHTLNIFINAGAESAEVRGEMVSFFHCIAFLRIFWYRYSALLLCAPLRLVFHRSFGIFMPDGKYGWTCVRLGQMSHEILRPGWISWAIGAFWLWPKAAPSPLCPFF